MMETQAFTVGQSVTWLYTPRGGYGFVVPVAGKVAKVGKARVQIWVQRKSSYWTSGGSVS